MAALRDFPAAQVHYMEESLNSLLPLSRVRQVSMGFIKGLLPEDFARRARPFKRSQFTRSPELKHSFDEVFDYFGDGSVLGISLPGHVSGQTGLFVPGESPVFLVADACWVSKAYRENLPPSALAFLLMDNKSEYMSTLHKIHTLHHNRQDIIIMPSHCGEVWEEHAHLKSWPNEKVNSL